MKVAVAGGFDCLHIGHLRHMKKAKALGNYLVVIVSTDADMVKKKGYCFMPLEERMELIENYPFVNEVVASIDKDGTVADTLRWLKPDIFAKGGDRVPDNIPQNEIDVCQEIGCKVVYGVGDKLQSSSDLVRKLTGDLSLWKLRKRDDRYEVYDSELKSFKFSVTYLNKGKSTTGHSHPWKELYTFVEGQGEIELDSTKRHIDVGDTLLILKDCFHRVYNHNSPRLVFLGVTGSQGQ